MQPLIRGVPMSFRLTWFFYLLGGCACSCGTRSEAACEVPGHNIQCLCQESHGEVVHDSGIHFKFVPSPSNLKWCFLFFLLFFKSVYFESFQVFFAACNNTIYSVIIYRIWHLKSSWMQEFATLISGYPPNQVSLEMRSTSSMVCLATRWAEKYTLPIVVAAVYAYLSIFNIFKLTVACCSYFIIPPNRDYFNCI